MQAKEWSRTNKSFVSCWQETWRAGDHHGLDSEETDDGWTLLWHGKCAVVVLKELAYTLARKQKPGGMKLGWR